MFVTKAIKSGEALADHAPPLYRDSLRIVASHLYFCNTEAALKERDLLVTQRHCMGRADESGVPHLAMCYVDKPTGALQFSVGRTKTSTLQNVHAFVGAESWESDIFHTKASHLVTARNVDKFHFQNASHNSINRILS